MGYNRIALLTILPIYHIIILEMQKSLVRRLSEVPGLVKTEEIMKEDIVRF